MSTPRSEVNVVVVDDYTNSISSQFVIKKGAEKIHFSGNKQNFELYVDAIEKTIDHKIHPLVMDLYRIAATVYISDLRLKRPSKTETRSISILIAVSDKSRWDSEKQHLESTLRFISGDHFTFHFVQGARPANDFSFSPNDEKVVSLFSGGLDSLAGVKWLNEQRKTPILVSHCSNNKICHAQTVLSTALKRIVGNNIQFFQVKARVKGGKDFTIKEYTQASRSFLYLTLGSILALEMGISNVYIFENGVLGLNIPLVSSRIFNNTRTAHPTFLANYNRLVSDIFPNTVNIENPFILLTKGEVVALLNDNAYKDLVKETITCSRTDRLRWQGVQNTKHCGICLPCVLRRIAIHHAGLWQHDDNYADNIFNDFNTIPQDGKILLFQLLQFGRTLKRDDNDVLIDVPQFYVEEIEDPAQLIAMMRRYIDELKNCIQDKASPSLKTNLTSL